jgi:hypothetical protein
VEAAVPGRLVTTLCLLLSAACAGPTQTAAPTQAAAPMPAATPTQAAATTPPAAPTPAAGGIGGAYSGRYQCGDWNTLDLVIKDEGAGRLSAVFTAPLQQGGAIISYALAGQYDERAGTFLLTPQRWVKRPPPGHGVTMVGMEGRYDPATKRLTGKIGSFGCGAVELAGAGGAPLPPLPPGSRVTPGQAANPALRVQPTVQGVEYWDASMAADGSGKRALRETEPIDDVIDWLKRQKYSCVGTQHVPWNAEGTRATARDRIDVRETYVIECDGDCRGLRFIPMTDASIYYYGRSQPAPVMQMKTNWAGGTVLQWVFTREAGGKPPDIYVHHWNAHSFNRTAGCRAPKSNNR